jgi:hypothetical protein
MREQAPLDRAQFASERALAREAPREFGDRREQALLDSEPAPQPKRTRSARDGAVLVPASVFESAAAAAAPAIRRDRVQPIGQLYAARANPAAYTIVQGMQRSLDRDSVDKNSAVAKFGQMGFPALIRVTEVHRAPLQEAGASLQHEDVEPLTGPNGPRRRELRPRLPRIDRPEAAWF